MRGACDGYRRPMDANGHLTPDDIVLAQFATTRFRPGYDPDEVDRLLDEVVATMRAHASGADPSGLPRASDLASVFFTQTRFRDGYETSEVDDLLDRVQATLAALEARRPPAG